MAGCDTGAPAFERPSTDNLDEQLHGAAIAAYQALGGVQAGPSLRSPGRGTPPAMEWRNELDEDLHFNRYRAITLDQPAYASLPGFPLALYDFMKDLAPLAGLGTVVRVAVWELVPLDGDEVLIDDLLRGVPDRAGSRALASLVRTRASIET